MPIPLSHTIFEITCFALLAICVIFRIKKKDMPITAIFMELFSIIAFGITIEIIAVSNGGYFYHDAHINVFEVPLYIGFGWASIVFSIMWLTDSFKMPEWSRVFFASLMVLLLNFIFDAVATRDQMWDWGIELDTDWFGVPWFNFVNWWFIVFSMSVALRLTRKLPQKTDFRALKLFYPIIAYVLALEIFAIIGSIQLLDWNLEILFVQMSISIIVIIWKWKGFKKPITLKKDFPIYLLPTVFYLLFISLLVIKGYYREVLPLFIISISMFVLNLLFLTSITIFSKKKPS